MPRRAQSFRRKITSDPIYKSEDVAKFINYIMYDGKKAIAQQIFYGAMDVIAESHSSPLEIFQTAIENVTPDIEVMSRRVGGSTYQVPIPVNQHRGRILAFRWLKDNMRKRTGNASISKLANEILDAYNKRGGAFAKKEELAKVAESSRAFAHYRW